LPNNRRRWDPDAGIVYLIVMAALIVAVMIFFINLPTP
jgi:hypothetical protein